jgi:hypothetical protein
MWNEFTNLALGTVVSVPRGSITHFGVVVGWADFFQPLIADASKTLGRVAARPLVEFADGAPCSVVGYLGNLPPEIVALAAYARMGEPYNLINANCEQFVNEVHGLEPKSEQLRSWSTVVGIWIGVAALLAMLIWTQKTAQA